MSATVALRALTFGYGRGGGHFWVYLNWSLALRALGCRVVWLEGADPRMPASDLREGFETVRRTLEPFGLDDSVAGFSIDDEVPLPDGVLGGLQDVSAVDGADLLLDIGYTTPPGVLARARRTALLDIDPGLTQLWWSERQMRIEPHDLYFTIGETVGAPDAPFPDCGVEWHYVPPAVFLPEWPVAEPSDGAPFTTLSHWWSNEWIKWGDEVYDNSKRYAFLQFVDLPRQTDQRLELALSLDGDVRERERLERAGWSVREGWEVAPTPHDYREFVRGSRGEFACAKPSCMRLRNAWVSDRTLCYLATGRPVIVQDTGPSEVLPNGEGMLRFSTMDEAVAALEEVSSDYDRHARAARRLAEDRFDAERAAASVLERALP